MQNGINDQNAVAAIRVSTTKQGRDGDSPEAQKEQIERFAQSKSLTIKKFFVFLESASKEQQPIQQAIDYCKNKSNEIDLFIIKSIDRFTRGGSDMYSPLRNQLDKLDIALVDVYGVISHTKINTLEHTGFEYKWSIYNPSKKSEILEAERSKDELRDILSRMIGAEIRYTQMGYWMRQPPYGYKSQKIDTQNGKRTILKPKQSEAKFITKMFELRATGRYNDGEIAKKLNQMGFKTRVKYIRSKSDPNRIVKQTGGKPITAKMVWRKTRKPIYAGVNMEKWTDGKPVKCMFDGLVSVDLFNKANHGKRMIVVGTNNKIAVYDKPRGSRYNKRGTRSADFPFKKYVMCPQCNKPLLGSASRGKSGKYYPAYHCNKRGHNFRVRKEDFDAEIQSFVGQLRFKPEHVDSVFSAIETAWERLNQEYQLQLNAFDAQISDLEGEARITVDKLKKVSSDTALKYMEEDLVRIENKATGLQAEKEQHMNKKPRDIKAILARAKYFVEHLDELLVKQIDPIKRAQFFGLIFDTPPTYAEIKGRTLKNSQITGMNPLFELLSGEKSLLVTPTGIEPVLPD